MNMEIQQTVFHIEKLQNVVNVGSTSVYQIFTSPGAAIGEFGVIQNPETQNPANDAVFNRPETTESVALRTPSWILKALSVFSG